MRTLPLLLVSMFLLAGCDSLPRDASDTTSHIRELGTIRVAIMPGTPDADGALTLLRNFAQTQDAKIAIETRHGEHALTALGEGRIEAVVGHFAKKSPWQTHVALSAAVGQPEPDDSHKPVLRIARRNGENGLILALDRAIATQP